MTTSGSNKQEVDIGDYVWYDDFWKGRHKPGILIGIEGSTCRIKNTKNRMVKRFVSQLIPMPLSNTIDKKRFFHDFENQFCNGYESDELYTYDFQTIRKGMIIYILYVGWNDCCACEFLGTKCISGVLRFTVRKFGRIFMFRYTPTINLTVATPEEEALYLLNTD